MDRITIKSGKGEITLRKATNLVGLKTTEETELAKKDYVEEEVIPKLGGFEVVSLKQEGRSLEDKLDEVRERQEIAVGTHVYVAEGSDKPMVPTGEIFVFFEEGVSEDTQQIVLNEYHLKLVERRSPTRVIAEVTSKSPNPIKTAHFLQNLSVVKVAEPDLDMQLDEYNFSSPGDDLLPHQWHLQNDGFVIDVNFRLKKGADAKVVDAWNRLGNTGSTKVTLAVIDNGFDLNHPDLKNQVVKPYDVWDNSSHIRMGDSRYTHGTPCASVALAATNGQGMVGAAPNARFMPINGTSFSLRHTEQMFDYCINNGADIISCSWGTTDPRFSLSPLKEEAIERAATKGRNGKGCVILFAAGNDDLDYINYYAAHPDVIAVGASTSQDSHASYSNRGRELSVVAPSNGDWPILAARANWDQGLSWEDGNFKYWRDGRDRGQHYKHFGGTSSATPLVAGICALILSANPGLTAKEVKEILQNTADKIGHPTEYINGHSTKYGYGRVNADKAVAEAIRRAEKPEITVEVTENVGKGKGLFRFDVKRQATQGWGAQIGAYYEYGNVLIEVEKLQRLFNAPVLVNINELRGRTVYKVVVGAFDSPNPARVLMQDIKAKGYSPFLRNLADLA